LANGRLSTVLFYYITPPIKMLYLFFIIWYNMIIHNTLKTSARTRQLTMFFGAPYLNPSIVYAEIQKNFKKLAASYIGQSPYEKG